MTEAKAAKEYRDALDAAMERALQAEQLEQEVRRYKGKLEQQESYRSRLEELKQDNQLLADNKEELAGQLDAYKVKLERMLQVEIEMVKLQQRCDRFAEENEQFREKIAELNAVNEELGMFHFIIFYCILFSLKNFINVVVFFSV